MIFSHIFIKNISFSGNGQIYLSPNTSFIGFKEKLFKKLDVQNFYKTTLHLQL